MKVCIFWSMLAFICSSIFLMILYHQSLDILLIWQSLLFISQFLFNNMKIAQFFIYIIIDCLIYNTNHYQTLLLESLFIVLFIILYSQHQLMRILILICRFFPPSWNYYFSLHFVMAFLLILRLAILHKFPHIYFWFISWYNSFDDSLISDNIV